MSVPFWLFVAVVVVLCAALFVLAVQRDRARYALSDRAAGAICDLADLDRELRGL